jgi:hypothetical protein
MKEYFQLIDFWTWLFTFLFSSTIVYYTWFFFARHPTDPTFIFLQIKVTIDNILCILCLFYQLLMILPYFKIFKRDI